MFSPSAISSGDWDRWHHGLSNLIRKGVFDVVIVRRQFLTLGDHMLVEAPGVFTLRALGVVGLVIGAHAMEQSCPHSGPHAVNITVDILGDGIAVVMLQPCGLLLGEATMTTPTQLLFFRQLQKGRPHSLVGVVDTFFFLYGDVGAIGCHGDNCLVCLGINVTQESSVHQAHGGNRTTPESLRCLYFHRIGATVTVDGAVVCVVHVPVVEGSCILTKLVAFEAAAVTVGGQQHIVHHQACHHLNHCSDTIHQSVALLLRLTSGYLDLVQRLEFGVDHLQKNAVYQIE